MEVSALIDRMAVTDVLNRYATACDTRNWALLDEVFTPDVEADYGGANVFHDRKAVVEMIRSMLGGCGPTQHLLGNYRITIDGDMAGSVCSVRAFHAGVGEAKGKTFEVWGEYRDRLVRTSSGWRIASRQMAVIWVEGSFDVLRPG